MDLHGNPTGRKRQHVTVLALFISGIVGSKSVHASDAARKSAPGPAIGSRVKRFERWYQNDTVTYEVHYLPIVEQLLAHLAGNQLIVCMDGSQVGRGCMTLMVCIIYQKRAIPLFWSVVQRPKGHFPAADHIELLSQVQAILPPDTQVVFVADGEFDSVDLQTYLQDVGWRYVCRTAKSIQVGDPDESARLDEYLLGPDDCYALENVLFTEQAFLVPRIILWWDKDEKEPIYLVTNLELTEEACYFYRRRMRIETFFSDQKSRGFNLHKSHVRDPKRLARILIASCLAYLWMLYLGASVLRSDVRLSRVHRTDRCDLSLFKLGMAWLDHLLEEYREIEISFFPPPILLFA